MLTLALLVAMLLTAFITDAAIAGENKLKNLPCPADQIIRSDGAGFICSEVRFVKK
jgi:hypothetical protein